VRVIRALLRLKGFPGVITANFTAPEQATDAQIEESVSEWAEGLIELHWKETGEEDAPPLTTQ
jgi:hypothetical protein